MSDSWMAVALTLVNALRDHVEHPEDFPLPAACTGCRDALAFYNQACRDRVVHGVEGR